MFSFHCSKIFQDKSRMSFSNIRLLGKRNMSWRRILCSDESPRKWNFCHLDAESWTLGNDNKSLWRHYNRNLVANDVNKEPLMSAATTNSIFQWMESNYQLSKSDQIKIVETLLTLAGLTKLWGWALGLGSLSWVTQLTTTTAGPWNMVTLSVRRREQTG